MEIRSVAEEITMHRDGLVRPPLYKLSRNQYFIYVMCCAVQRFCYVNSIVKLISVFVSTSDSSICGHIITYLDIILIFQKLFLAEFSIQTTA
jgi:hypothetical protein